MHNRELWLASTLVELADTSDADFDEAAYSRRVAERLAQLAAPAVIGVLIAEGSRGLQAAAASSELGYRLACLSADHGKGPAAACYESGRPLLNEALDTAIRRWPRFAAAACTAGFEVVSALPMRRHDETVGAIIVLAAGGYRLGATETSLVLVLAEVAAVAILQRRALSRSVRTAEQLQHALHSRIVIEQAKGVLAARLGVTPEAAFGLLRGFARRHGRLLADVSGATIRGELTARELLAGDTSRRPVHQR